MKSFALSLVLALAITSSIATAQSTPKATSPNPNLHYAYRHTSKDENEHFSVNWNGVVIWNNHSTETDALWIQQNGKAYRITDADVLKAMYEASKPLRRSMVTATPGTKAWQEEREKERNAVYAKTDKIIEGVIAKGLPKPVERGEIPK